MECIMPSVEGLRENRTEKKKKKKKKKKNVVGLGAGERSDCSEQALETEGSE